MTSDITSYQTSRLAELDTQLALCNQRVSRLDQQLIAIGQAITDSSARLTTSLNTLIAAADAWMAQQSSNPTAPALVQKMQGFKLQLLNAGSLNLSDAASITSLKTLAEQLQIFSSELVDDLTKQAKDFAEALDKAAIDLATHYGVQI